MYKINISRQSVISSSENSTEIRLIIVLIIIGICTKKNKNVPYKKLSYIFSNISRLGSENRELKEFLTTWDIEDIRPLIILGKNNGLWDLEIKDRKMVLSPNTKTNEIFDEIVGENSFETLRAKVEILSSISNAKLDRYKLVW